MSSEQLSPAHAWHVPFWQDDITLRSAHESLKLVGLPPEEMPLLIRLVENPDFHLHGLGFFKGRVSLEQHDFIHIVLGRGLQPIDEAFVIGFTMGSTDRVSTFESKLFTTIAQYLYPEGYRFDARCAQVVRDAIALGYVSDCSPLDKVDFHPMLDMPLREVRRELHLETDLLTAYYRIEARRYPDSYPSQRLIPAEPIAE